MTLRYDQDRRRIICRWEEPTRIVIDKREGTIKRSRSISVKVSETGKLNSKDSARHAEHPMYRHISNFNSKLNKMNYFPLKHEGYKCSVCGSERDVNPHFDVNGQNIIWLCRDHQRISPKIDA